MRQKPDTRLDRKKGSLGLPFLFAPQKTPHPRLFCVSTGYNNRMEKTLFLDRDGVINVDTGYVHRKEDFIFIDGLIEALQQAQEKGYQLIVVTNQSGIGRGYYSEEQFHSLNQWMLDTLAANQVTITQVYYCPHSPQDNCACRKPEPGMLVKAIGEHEVDTESSWMIGDSERDIEAAQRAGVKNTVFYGSIEKQTHADHHISSLNELPRLLT